MNVPKDIYKYLFEFADDRTIINMLLVNKKIYNDLLNDEFFLKLLTKRYPYLIDFNPKTLWGRRYSWKNFYLREIYAISKLEEDFGIPYISNEYYFEPYNFYQEYKNAKEYIYDKAASYGILTKDLDVVKRLIDISFDNGYPVNLNELLKEASFNGAMDIVKYLIKLGATDFDGAMMSALDGEQEEIYDYLQTLT